MSPREDTQAVTTAMRESYMLVTHAHDGCLALCHGTTWLGAHVIEATQFYSIYFFNVLLEVVVKERFPRLYPQPTDIQEPVLKRLH